ncbi:MAG TPA: hypothetical protein VJ910_14210 [Desulfuromonadales bacterium]|nr:hypothetical protein [Desulfuromonadales bacterium]
MQNDQQHVPLAEAARRMKTTPLNVLMHVKRGLLEGTEVNGNWLIDGRSLEALLAETGGRSDNVCTSGCTGGHGCSRN